jgi:hypothetical protein
MTVVAAGRILLATRNASVLLDHLDISNMSDIRIAGLE